MYFWFKERAALQKIMRFSTSRWSFFDKEAKALGSTATHSKLASGQLTQDVFSHMDAKVVAREFLFRCQWLSQWRVWHGWCCGSCWGNYFLPGREDLLFYITLVLQIPCEKVFRYPFNPVQNHLQKGLEQKVNCVFVCLKGRDEGKSDN